MTSGTNTFNETRDQLITNALSLLGAVSAGESPNTNDLTFGASCLNAMVKAWMAQGIHLWTEEEGTIYFVNGQAQYNLQAGASGAQASDGSGTPVETTLATNASGGSISVVNGTGMSINDTIGIQLNNNSIFWTTISNVSVNNVTLAAPLSSSANAGNQVFSYTTQLPRPLSIQSCRLRDNNGFDRAVWIKPRNDYMMIPQKAITGDPIVLYYTPQITNGVVYVWPAPSDVSKRLKVTYLRTIQDFDSGTDQPDFPQEWLECITYNLAIRLAPAFGISLSSGGISGNPDLLRQAAQYLDDLKAWDSEQPYFQLVPNYRYNR